jgi:hypothetical protein
MTEISQATKIVLGAAQAAKVYAGTKQVWPEFRPTHLSGCAIWLDASRLALANGGAVSSWPNLGSGSQPTITAGATFRTNALGTLPVVRITQGTGKMRWYSGTGVDKDWTLIYYGRRWGLRPGRVIAAFGTSANLLVGFHGNEMDMCYVEEWITSPSAPLTSTQWKLYSADSTSTALARFFSNGVLKAASTTVTPAKGWGGTFCISGYLDSALVGDSQETDCEIAEVVLYNRKLSDAERQQVEGYLRTKWGVPPLFKPTDYGSWLLAWFDGNDAATVQITGSGVANWINKGAGTMTLIQTTDAQKPTYDTNNKGVNFDQGQILTPANAPSPYDLFAATTPNPSSVDWRTLMRSAGAHEVIMETGSTRLGTYYGGFLPSGLTAMNGIPVLLFARAAPSTAVVLSLNGGALASTVTTLSAGSVATTMFGGYASAPPSQAWGRVNELILFTHNYDTARQLLEGYLAWKWNRTGLLPAGHPYKTAAP